jgi:hypothetical protein
MLGHRTFLMPDSEELGIAENTPMAALVNALEMRETAREVGGMVRGIQDFLTPQLLMLPP